MSHEDIVAWEGFAVALAGATEVVSETYDRAGAAGPGERPDGA